MNRAHEAFAFYQELMDRALKEARIAFREGEVPVGAALWLPDGTILTDHNRIETCMNSLAHAEIRVLQQAQAKGYRHALREAILAVTLEPCPMCAGALTLARLGTLVYGAEDPRVGACGTRFELFGHPIMNHRPILVSGIRAWESRMLLKTFFRQRRSEKRDVNEGSRKTEKV